MRRAFTSYTNRRLAFELLLHARRQEIRSDAQLHRVTHGQVVVDVVLVECERQRRASGPATHAGRFHPMRGQRPFEGHWRRAIQRPAGRHRQRGLHDPEHGIEVSGG